jgi:LysR family transcriptional regulator (chromosome initiation inhibitor)
MAPEHLARPEFEAGRLVELVPGRHLEVPLHWQRWRLDSLLLEALTASVKKAAGAWLY